MMLSGFVFIFKVIAIELVLQLARHIVYACLYTKQPDMRIVARMHPIAYYGIMIAETLMITVLLYYTISMYWIIPITFVAMICIQKIALIHTTIDRRTY